MTHNQEAKEAALRCMEAMQREGLMSPVIDEHPEYDAFFLDVARLSGAVDRLIKQDARP